MTLSLHDLHQAGIAAGLAWLFLMGVVYLVVFLSDRRRSLYMWLAIQASAAAVVPWAALGLPRFVLDYQPSYLLMSFVPVACAASLYFTHVQFGLKRPSWVWPSLFAAAWVASQAATYVGLPVVYGERITAMIVAVTIAYQIGVLARLARQDAPPVNVNMMLGCWSVVALASAVDLGAGALSATPLALTVFAFVQTMALAREHLARIEQTEVLKEELASRLEVIEASYREIDVLNEELRRQIGLRSRQLAEVLARVNADHSGADTLEPGRVIDGRYRITGILGRGAMGVVYQVCRLADDKRFALKVLKRQAGADDMTRFAREAEILAKLHHPNLVAIVDVDICDSGLLFIVMELVDGAALDRLQPLGAGWALSVIRQISEGLAAVHRRGVIHRDLKPANILVSGVGDALNVKIADFGVSSLPSRQAYMDTRPMANDDTAKIDPAMMIDLGPLTEANVVMGTPNYMAPELVHGSMHSKPATDMFSLGIIAFELLTGTRPFDEPPFAQQLRGETPIARASLSTLLPTLDPAVARLLQGCLAHNPDERPTARQLTALLREMPASQFAIDPTLKSRQQSHTCRSLPTPTN